MNRSSRLLKPAYFALGLAMVAIVWKLDLRASPQVSMSIFYLLPIGFVAWFCGGAWTYAMPIIAATAWLQAEIATGPAYENHLIIYWNAVMVFGYFTIVTALAGLIARLRRLNDREREISELKSGMVSLVSHEFGNFLTTFKLSLTLLEESESADAPAQRRQCYATLDRVYTHLSNAVANFLNLNRIESGRFVPHLKETAMRTLIHATVSRMGPLIEDKKVELKLDFPAHPVRVQGDPDALSVIMSNLIGNAFKYTPAGGAVTVRLALEPSTALVRVEDTGIGIPEEDRERITSGFYRGEAGRKVAKGFGVGLKVTHELLESLGARLEIASGPGGGSAFFFRLPLWRERT